MGYWLKHYREKKGLSQSALGRQTDMGRTWPWLVEMGLITNPKINSLEEAARVLGIKAGDLLKPLPQKKPRKAAA